MPSSSSIWRQTKSLSWHPQRVSSSRDVDQSAADAHGWSYVWLYNQPKTHITPVTNKGHAKQHSLYSMQRVPFHVCMKHRASPTVWQHLVCLWQLFKLPLCVLLVVWVLVWVPLQRKFPVAEENTVTNNISTLRDTRRCIKGRRAKCHHLKTSFTVSLR